MVSLAQPLHRHLRLAEVVERVHPPQAWGPLLHDGPVSRSFDRPDLQALAHFRNCYSTEQVPQPYFSPFLPQHPYEGAFACFARMVAESHRSCMRTSEPNSMLNFGESPKGEVRRIPIPGNSVNKCKSKLGLLLAPAFRRIVDRKPSCRLLHSRKPRGVRLAPVVYDVDPWSAVARVV